MPPASGVASGHARAMPEPAGALQPQASEFMVNAPLTTFVGSRETARRVKRAAWTHPSSAAGGAGRRRGAARPIRRRRRLRGRGARRAPAATPAMSLRFCHWRQIERVIATLQQRRGPRHRPLSRREFAARRSYWRGSGALARLRPMSGRGEARAAARLLCAAAVPRWRSPRRCSRNRRRPATRRARSVGAARSDARPRRRMARPRTPPEPAEPPTAEDAGAAEPQPERHRRGRRSRRARPRAALSLVALEGLEAIGSAAELIERVRRAVGAAQGPQRDRQCRADRPPLARRRRAARRAAAQPGLLRCRGRAARSSGRRARCWSCSRPSPGRNTASSRSSCRGSRRPGAEAAKLREAFAVKAGDPVVAEKVIAAGVALQVALGEQGFAAGRGRRAGHRRSTTRRARARLVLPVDAGAGGARSARSASAASRRSRSRHVAAHRPVQAGRPFRALEGRRPAPRADRHRPGRVGRGPAGAARRRPDGRPRRQARAGADADHRRRARLRHRRGRSGRGELAAPQLLQSRRRADRARGGRHAGAARRGPASAATISCGATRCSTLQALGQPRRPRRL